MFRNLNTLSPSRAEAIFGPLPEDASALSIELRSAMRLAPATEPLDAHLGLFQERGDHPGYSVTYCFDSRDALQLTTGDQPAPIKEAVNAHGDDLQIRAMLRDADNASSLIYDMAGPEGPIASARISRNCRIFGTKQGIHVDYVQDVALEDRSGATGMEMLCAHLLARLSYAHADCDLGQLVRDIRSVEDRGVMRCAVMGFDRISPTAAEDAEFLMSSIFDDFEELNPEAVPDITCSVMRGDTSVWREDFYPLAL